MTSTSDESLFSLEVLVDRLTIPKVQCRFPAIVFRLLDFPTVIIHHVDIDTGQLIKRKLEADPTYTIPNQLPELLDTNRRYFSIQKGKSCLLKMSPDSLYEMLLNTPMYVMIVDTYCPVPKLVGNCTVPLDEVMTRLFNDIESKGLSVPSVQGEKGQFKIYNLMGVEIGEVSLGIRLLSFGVGLIPHISSASIVQPQKKNFSIITQKRQSENIEVQEPLKVSPRQRSVPENFEQQAIRIQSAAPVTTAQSKQAPGQHVEKFAPVVDMTIASTQTDNLRRKKKLGKYVQLMIEETDTRDDIIATNTVCPPPLYFNSEAEPQYKWGLKFFNYRETDTASIDDEVSETGTIRSEDKFTVDDFDVESSPVQRYSEKSSRKIVKDKESKETKVSKKVPHANLFRQFPLLNALVSEIVALQGASSEPVIEIAKPVTFSHSKRHISSVSPLSPIQSRSSLSRARSTSPFRSPSPGRERQSVEKFVERMHTPRLSKRELPEMKHRITRKSSTGEPIKKAIHTRNCQHPKHGVPKEKSWIRQVPEPVGPATKTKLSYGLTNTQKLRIGKVNQELLKTLEKKEEARKKKWRETYIKMSATTTATTTRKTSPKPAPKRRGSIPKKPVPTPRLSKTLSMEYIDLTHLGYEVDESKDLENVTDSQNIKSSSDLHMTLIDDIAGKESFNDLQERMSDHGSQVSELQFVDDDIPLPRDPVTDRAFSQEVPYQSVDAEELNTKSITAAAVLGIDAGELLGLRKIVQHYSDGENSFESTGSFQSPHESVTSVSGMKYIPPIASDRLPTLKTKEMSTIRTSNASVVRTFDSTAYFTQSQIPSSGEEHEDRYSPSPTKTDPVVRSDSVSSYAPTEQYSDETFEEDTDNVIVHELDNITVASEAAFGYTF